MVDFYKFLKFGLVGLGGMVIDFTLTYLFKEKLKVNKYVANGIGFICAATSNYYWNRRFTFESHNENIGVEYSEFLLVALTGLAVNSTVLWLLTTRFKMKFYVAKVFAIGAAVLWNFTANYLFVFAS